MKPKPEEVLKLASAIVEMKKSLEELQKSWDALFSDDAPTPSARKNKDGSGPSRILTLLSEKPEQDFEAKALSDLLGIPLGTTRTILSKLTNHNQIEKRGAGKYGANRSTENVTA
jgi:hypothetical protein